MRPASNTIGPTDGRDDPAKEAYQQERRTDARKTLHCLSMSGMVGFGCLVCMHGFATVSLAANV